MYTLFILFMSFSCAHLIEHHQEQKEYIKPITLESSSDTPFNNNNFVGLEKYYLQDDEGNYCTVQQDCQRFGEPGSEIATASGGAIKMVNSKIYALTAGHFCSDYGDPYYEDPDDTGEPDDTANEEIPSIAKTFRAIYMGISTRATVEHIDESNDLCLVSFKIDSLRKIEKIKLANSMPAIGDTVYTVSAPLAIMGNSIRLHFVGQYSGCDPSIGCLYTIPATFGSSGSLVLNKKGRLISVIQISVIPFKHIAAGPSIKEIKYFFQQYEELSGIKLY